jgi:DNA polymerase III subunit delta
MVAMGDPHPALSRCRFTAMAGGIYLIHGPEEVLRERHLKEILKNFSSKSNEIEKRSLDGAELEPSTFTEATSPSLFSEERILIIRNIAEIDSEILPEIDRYLENPDPQLLTVFLHHGGVKGKGLLDRIKKVSQVLTAEALKRPGDRAEFVKEEFAARKRKIKPDALTALISGYSDMRELTSVARQICADFPSEKVIERSDVLKYTQGRKLTSAYDVADLVIAREPERALVAARFAFDCGVEPMAILSAVSYSIKSMLKVVDLPRHVKSFEVAGELEMAPWQIDKARRALCGWSESQFELALNEIVRADFAVKGGEAHPEYAIERLILAIASSGKLLKSPDQSRMWRKASV